MKALVFNNIVQEVTETEFEVHESFVWMDCSDDCIAGWLLENGALTAPPHYQKRTIPLKDGKNILQLWIILMAL